ncbi:helix-turn-helix transcriptional regulator, partial [Pseudomonas viridiflava]|uniref:helix-turn-helix transcriptional regulator n=1 Tax=Pseudomonas viridiflava TaxID=33069 RepID=UPI003C7C1AFA
MKMMNSLVFQPTWVSPPGETILDILYDRQISPESLAEHIGYDAKNISALFNGREEISERLAQRLAAAIGPDAEFWLNREKQYRDDVSRIYRNTTRAEDNWLAELPIKSMQSFGWIPTSDSKSKKVI